MIYVRDEGGTIRQGFNFYPRSDEGSAGCQMLFGPLRVEVRWSKRRKRLRVGAWLREKPELSKTTCIYIPGYTEEMKKLYEENHYNRYWNKKYEDWVNHGEA